MGCQPLVPRAGSPRYFFVPGLAALGYRNVPRAASPRYNNVLGLPALGSKGLQIIVWVTDNIAARRANSKSRRTTGNGKTNVTFLTFC